jgi:protein phosphatase
MDPDVFETGEQPTLGPFRADATLPPLTLRVAARSECGPVRSNNEDRFLVVRFDRTTTPIATNIDEALLPSLPPQSFWALAVADGMGGHAAGEVASTLALTLALQFSQQGSRWYVAIRDPEVREITVRIESILQSVDRAISQHASTRAAYDGMGTTLTVAAAVGDRLFISHIGDSRAYLLRKDRLARLTRDHSLAQDLVDAGALNPVSVARHSSRHVLTQAMGRGDILLDIHVHVLEDGDRLLLTTDGVTDSIADAELEELARPGDTRAACERLVSRALAAGSKDNVTAIVADVELP